MKFYLLRVKILALIIKIFGFLLAVELPPIPSVAAIIVKDGKLLVVKLSYRGGFSLPGGVVQTKETIEDALRREVKEETGLEVVEAQYFGSFIAGKEFPGINLAFVVSVKGSLKSSKEGIALWKDPQTILDKLVYKDNLTAVKKYFDFG